MIGIHVEMQGLTQIEAALGMTKDKSKMVMRTAINNAAKRTEDRMADGARTKYRYKNAKKADIKEANKVDKATTGKPEAFVRASGKTNDLVLFRVRPNMYFPGSVGAPPVISAKALNGGSFKPVVLKPNASGDKYKAFVVRYANKDKDGNAHEHFALAQRVPGKKMRSKPRKEAIKNLYSISIPKMEEMVYKEKLADGMYDVLQQSIQEQILRYVK